MPALVLLDIIEIEYSLGDKILSNNTAIISKYISNTCKIFNKISKEELKEHRIQYYNIYLPKKIEETIENKMFSILKNPNNKRCYKEYIDYEEDLKNLALDINSANYDSILLNLINLLKDYVEQYSYNKESGDMFGILMNELYKFIKFHMKYEIKKEDFLEYDEEIYDVIKNL